MPTPIPPEKIPRGFVDPFPQRGPWLDPADPPKPGALDVEVLLADGTFEAADYVAAAPPNRPQPVWWHFKELHPIGWRSFYHRGHSA
jgi:hypothetical protein